MTNKELSLQVRKELKEHGYNTRDFKVSVKDCGYNTSINVVIKNPHINARDVKGILWHFRDVDYDERTGEILQGANVYLKIEYEYGVFDIVAQEYAVTARGIMDIIDGLYFVHDGNCMELRQDNGKERCAFIICSFKELCIMLYKFSEFGTIGV